MSKRRSSALAVLAMAVAAVFVLPASPASAGSATVPNGCTNTASPNEFSQLQVTTSGDDGLTSVAPGGTTTLTVSQSGSVPGTVFVAGYNLGILQLGTNIIPATAFTTIEATNTVEGVQTTNTAATSVTTIITDPDGLRSSGDEEATPATFDITYNDLTWTANGPEGSTIEYRQDTGTANPPTAANNTLFINAVVLAGVIEVAFRCTPAIVTDGVPPNPDTMTLIDPADSFDTTLIQTPPPVDDPPIADAGLDQLVDDGDLVTLDGTGSSDPENEALTYAWTAPAGVTLSDPNSAQPTFTAVGPASLTFTLEVCDEADPVSQCDTDTVVINVGAPPMIDAAGDVIVNGPVGPSTRKTSKSFVFKVCNVGTTPITITAADITTSVTVDGTVDVAGLPVTLGPGSCKRLKAVWSYASGAFAAGDTVEFNACVNLTGDIGPLNNCDTATVTAK